MQSTVASQVDLLSQVGLDHLKKGELGIFCGAGISINSGLPSANSLKEYMLFALTDNKEDVDAIVKSRIPFEAFVERIFQTSPFLPSGDYISGIQKKIKEEKDEQKQKFMEEVLRRINNINSPQDAFLKLFSSNELQPNRNHFLIARLARMGYLDMVVTTNFDCLIEAACMQEGMKVGQDFLVVYDEKEYEKISDNAFQGLVIYKIHGSAEDMTSIRTTLQHVADQTMSADREQIIKKLFQTGQHKKVLILGYSFSDHFDISPAIQRIIAPGKNVVYQDYQEKILDVLMLSDISDQDSKRVIRNFDGHWLKYDTNLFVDALWDVLDLGKSPLTQTEKPRWQDLLDGWYQDISSPSNVMTRLWIMSTLMDAVAEHERAIYYIKKCIEIAERNEDHSSLTVLIGNLAVSQLQLGRMAESHRTADQALHMAEKNDDQSAVARNIISSTVQLMLHGDYEGAFQKYQEALKIGIAINDDEVQAVSYGGLANACSNMSRSKEAETYAHKAIEQAQKRPTPAMMKAQCRSEVLLCRIYSNERDLSKAKKHGDEAKRLGELLGDKTEVVAALVGLATTLMEHNERNDAEKYYLEALPMTIEIKNVLFEYVCRFMIGKINVEYSMERGIYSSLQKQRIGENFERAIEIADSINKEDAKAECLYFWGLYFHSTGNLETATKHYTEVMRICEKSQKLNYFDYARQQLVRVYKTRARDAKSFSERIKEAATAEQYNTMIMNVANVQDKKS